MRKYHEVRNPNSCLNKATDGEMIFILLGRDPAAPHAIREWIKERIRLGRNDLSDYQIIDASFAADTMEKEAKP